MERESGGRQPIDRTLLRENLKLPADHRVQKMLSALRLLTPPAVPAVPDPE